MGQLTNGSFSYERRVKTGDFEHKHAAVTIHYALDEGDDADELLARARTLVVQHVHQAVGIKGKADPVPVAGNGPDPVVASSPAVELEPTAAAQPVPELIEIEPPATNLKEAKKRASKKPTVTEAVVEEIIEDPTAGPAVGETPSVGPSPAEVVDDFTAAGPAATDAELGSILSRVNTKLRDRPRIQALIGEYVQQGESYTKIPDVRRAEFISRLEAL